MMLQNTLRKTLERHIKNVRACFKCLWYGWNDMKSNRFPFHHRIIRANQRNNIHTLTLFRYVAKTLNQGSMCALMRSKLCVRIHGCKCSFCSVLSKIVKKYSDIPQTMAETSRWIFRYCPFVNEIRNKRRSVILTGFCMPFFSICFHFNAFWIALYTFSTT